MDAGVQSPQYDDEASKKTLGVLETFRNSIRKSPLTPGSRGSKNQSPSTPVRTPHSPDAASPLRSAAALFQTKDQDDQSQKGRPVTRSGTEPNMARLDSLLKKGASIRRGLRFSSKKDKRQDASEAVREEGVAKEEDEGGEGGQEQGGEDEQEACEEMEETYVLPELPDVPLSVMQISKLIEMEVLEEAHLHLLALRAEFQRERQCLAQEDSPVELAKKEKDLSLLYADLRQKMASIVRTSVSFPARNKELLVHVARIVQEEDKRAQEPGGLQGSWMDAWREAVDQGVRDKVEGVHLEPTDRSSSWLAVHLGLLGKALVEDLEKVKNELRWSYPPSFRIFATYVQSYHAAVGRHLHTLEALATLPKDLYALLDWVVHRYRSERIMGSPALEPHMSQADVDLLLDRNFLLGLRDKFCRAVKEDMRACLDRLVELENEDMWSVRKHPDMDDDHLLTSIFHMDICTKMSGNVVNAGRVDAQLEGEVTAACLGELKDFPKRFHGEFRRHCWRPRSADPLWSEYQVTYINCFQALQQHLEESYMRTCPHGVEAAGSEVTWLLQTLREDLQQQFKDDVKPYLRRMMTRKWLTNDEDFNGLHAGAELLAQRCEAMRAPHRQEVAGAAHYHVVKEYVGQLMKGNYSCKNRKHLKAAAKMRAQCSKLADVFRRMGSREAWLDPVGDGLSDILGQKNKSDIKDHLKPLLDRYPDFSARHLTAVLAFRGVPRGREHQRILSRLERLRGTGAVAAATSRAGGRSLFGDMEAAFGGDCLADASVFCFAFVFPGR